MSIDKDTDKKEAVDMLATPMQRAIIIDKSKTNEFAKKLAENAPNKEYWDKCNKSAESLNMERLYRLYDNK